MRCSDSVTFLLTLKQHDVSGPLAYFFNENTKNEFRKVNLITIPKSPSVSESVLCSVNQWSSVSRSNFLLICLRSSNRARKARRENFFFQGEKNPAINFHQSNNIRQMKPIESDLMEPENPRVYRLVLTGGRWCGCAKEGSLSHVARKGKSRGFSESLFIFRHHPVALFLIVGRCCSSEHFHVTSMCFPITPRVVIVALRSLPSTNFTSWDRR